MSSVLPAAGRPMGTTQWDKGRPYGTVTLSNSCLTATTFASNPTLVVNTTYRNKGKRYFELHIGSRNIGVGPSVGLVYNWPNDAKTDEPNTYYLGSTPIDRYINGVALGGLGGGSMDNGDIMSVAVNFATQKIWFGRNGVWYLSGDPAADTNQCGSIGATGYFISMQGAGTVTTLRPRTALFTYSAPSGFTQWE